MAEIKILEAHDVPAIDPARHGQWDKFVTYLVDGALKRSCGCATASRSEPKEKIVEAIRRDNGRAEGARRPHLHGFIGGRRVATDPRFQPSSRGCWRGCSGSSSPGQDTALGIHGWAETLNFLTGDGARRDRTALAARSGGVAPGVKRACRREEERRAGRPARPPSRPTSAPPIAGGAGTAIDTDKIVAATGRQSRAG